MHEQFVQEARGAFVVLGNHDAAALGRSVTGLNSAALTAIAWTQERLGERQRAFLGGLPLCARHDDVLFVHASAAAPATVQATLRMIAERTSV